MNTSTLRITGPYTHGNLTLFLFHGSDAVDGSRFTVLEEAMDTHQVTVHETGNVGQLEIENLSDAFDLFVQAGDLVKGGRQDRAIGVDFVVPKKSGRIPVPVFCVESGRWHRRQSEDAHAFSSSKSSVSSRKVRLAAKLARDQGEVWHNVAEAQADLSKGIEKEVAAAASPSSYQLSVEHADLVKRKDALRQTLEGMIHGDLEGAIGMAFAVGGQFNTADIYGSHTLFAKLRGKLLDTAVLESIVAPWSTAETGATPPPTSETLSAWMAEAQEAKATGDEPIPPRVRVQTRRGEQSVVFDTHDIAFADALLHRNVILAN